MPSLMKVLAITVAILFTTTNAANAFYSPNASPSSVGPITVALVDGALNACWTNLREAREYAEEKLEIEGYDVLAEGGEYTFHIDVLSKRDNLGTCDGFVDVTIDAINIRNGVVGFHQIGRVIGMYVNQDNLNTAVIEVISEMIGQM